MYGQRQVEKVLELVAEGHSYASISRATGVSRFAIRSWVQGELPGRRQPPGRQCAVCSETYEQIPVGPYAYLLGLYLGDGCLSFVHRGVYKLRIACCDAYPGLMEECVLAMQEILQNRVCRVHGVGCTEISSCSKHWLCYFPQHGAGRKHERKIVLSGWQRQIVDSYPAPFLRGLLHSDGCRVLNWVNGTPYPRYHFSNTSADIRGLFGRACDTLGVAWRPHNVCSLSVARRASVRILDEFVGPKK